MALTKNDIREVVEEAIKTSGVITRQNFSEAQKEYGVATEKKMKVELNKVKKDLEKSIANVALTSPTINQFNGLEKRVDKIEVSTN